MLQIHLSRERIAYTGEQLQAGWAAVRFGLVRGQDCAAAFLGPCDVDPKYMVDLEDLAAGSRIYSEEMAHIIIEHVGADLEKAVLRQRMLVCLAAERLNSHLRSQRIVRRGNDLYDGERKLSVSIATASEHAALIHFGINVHTSDFPVPVKGIEDYGIDPRRFAEGLLQAYEAESRSVEGAQRKVRRVGQWPVERDG
jgi:hypothetical protein